MEILEYLDPDESSPFARWFDTLDVQAARRVVVALARIELGNLSNTKSVGTGVLESRIDAGPGYRIYFGRDGDKLVIFWLAARSAASRKIFSPHATAGLSTSSARRHDHMALTRSFKDTVIARIEREPAFRDALLTEAVERFLSGDIAIGKAILRDYINATIGFERLAQETGTSSKSLMRMLSPAGNPTASNLFGIIVKVQKAAGIHLAVAVA